MKKRHSTEKKAVALTSAASLLGTSCSGYLEPSFYEGDIKTEKENQLPGTRSLPICDGLTQDEYAFMDATIRLIEDLINENIDSSMLVNDSKGVLKSYGYTGDIVMDHELLIILSAFGKPEFVKAVKNQDIESFFNIAKKNGLLRFTINQNTKNSNFNSLPEPTKQLITNIRNSKTINSKDIVKRPVVSDWFVDSVAVAAVIALAGIEVAVVVMVVVLVVGHSDQGPKTANFSTQVSFNKLMNARRVDVWDAFTQRNGTMELYNFMDNRVTELCDVTIKAIDEICPEYWDNHSKTEIRNSLGVTFMNYLFESEL